jgi:hypothetical protein
METPGTLIDKLCTVDLKMWNNQEALYEIRRMTYEEFCKKFGIVCSESDKCMAKGTPFELYNILKKACDLNVQRNNLMNEVDEKMLEMFRKFAVFTGIDDGKINNCIAQMNQIYSIKPHKTY